MKNDRLTDLIAEIEDEVRLLKELAREIKSVWSTLPREIKARKIHEESVALKLHNFYTGCERIFRRISDDLNGGVPTSPDWHKRLLHRMTLEIKGIRPPVLSGKTEKMLTEFLGFRHIVRNIYGFQIDSERLSTLVEKFPTTFSETQKDIKAFTGFLKNMG
jgi:hypothetical protein